MNTDFDKKEWACECAKWIISGECGPVESPFVDMQKAGKVIAAFYFKQITRNDAKAIFRELRNKDEELDSIVKRLSIRVISEEEICQAIGEAFFDFKSESDRLRAGEIKMLGFFIGKVNAVMRNRADPMLIKSLLESFILK